MLPDLVVGMLPLASKHLESTHPMVGSKCKINTSTVVCAHTHNDKQRDTTTAQRRSRPKLVPCKGKRKGVQVQLLPGHYLARHAACTFCMIAYDPLPAMQSAEMRPKPQTDGSQGRQRTRSMPLPLAQCTHLPRGHMQRLDPGPAHHVLLWLGPPT